MLISRRLLLLTSLASATISAPSRAQSWPSKTIRIVVPFPAGGSADLSARLLAEHLKAALGHSVVVESEVGAGGNLAAAEAARAEADGHTLFVGTNGTQTINESLYRNIPYDPAGDFSAITMMWEAPHLFVVHPTVPAQSLEAFLNYARSNAGSLSYGSSGVGSSTHLFAEMFKARTGLEITHVPYRGQALALNDLLGGQIKVMFPIIPDVISYIRSGQVRAIALASENRSDLLPDLPLMPRLGYPDLVASAWTGLYVPTRTPPAVIERLRSEADALLHSASFVDRMKQVGVEIRPIKGGEFEAFTQQERARWAKTIAELKIRIE